MIPLSYILVFSSALFGLGLFGALVQRNAIRVLMCIELMLNAVNVNLVAFSRVMTPQAVTGQVFAIFVLTVAAAEAAVGLALILSAARRLGHIDLDRMNLLKW
ncbi:MAG TPA: NADH-quinone oxidoreductase subunit NuoK [Limnochordia bacterium]|nr:NADH-quinone oxidoreductase subunit NuoK [Limnochordia bacterium]